MNGAVFAMTLMVSVSGSMENPPDLEGLREALHRTELAFAATVRDKDFDAFLTFIDEDAVFASGETLRGRERIGRAWSVYFAPEAKPLEWEPARVEISSNGELGMSTGPYWFDSQADDGQSIRMQGTFFSVWRRQEDGTWRIIFDTGTAPRPLVQAASE